MIHKNITLLGLSEKEAKNFKENFLDDFNIFCMSKLFNAKKSLVVALPNSIKVSADYKNWAMARKFFRIYYNNTGSMAEEDYYGLKSSIMNVIDVTDEKHSNLYDIITSLSKPKAEKPQPVQQH